MTTVLRCPQCGLILAPNAPRGLCPGCLFKGALETHASATGGGFPTDGLGDAPPTPQELAPDFPELEILRFVGRGGMGMVYQARQKQLDRMVALKILSPRIARDSAFAERFAREARTMALLSHPHIVTVHEFGTASPPGTVDRDVPLYYLLMEFVDGLTLRQLLDAGQLTPPQAFAIVPQICEALQYAHDKGVVHRDIKPENILLDRQGNVKIADFGLAKLMGLQGHDITISTTGQVLGTLHYMAPEQMERPLEVDHRADIYSLGVVFYQMLTGELPLGRFAPPSQKVLVDARLDEVVLRALEKEPERRYQQASALQSQVESIAVSSAAFPPGKTRLTVQPRSWLLALKGTSRVSRIIAVSVFVCALLGFLVFTANVRRSSTNASLADSPQELRSATTARVIQAGIEKPLSPWAWQELERRSLTADDANSIVGGLTEWLRREHPTGMRQPLSWLDNFLKTLDERGLVPDERKIAFLEALHGELHGAPLIRLREGTRNLSLNVEWKCIWNQQLFGMKLLNEARAVTVDDESVSLTRIMYATNWDSDSFGEDLEIPPLKPGKHRVRLEVLSALAPESDLVGLDRNARSTDWPPAKKRWTRSVEMELVVFPEGSSIISQTQDPAVDPISHGFTLEPILVRRKGGRAEAVLKFVLNGESLAVPISFDVSLRIDGQTIACPALLAARQFTSASVSTKNGSSDYQSFEHFTVDLPEVDAGVNDAEVVLTPNPKWIELQPDVDRIWGKKVVLRNVPLRRLDSAEPMSNDDEASVNQ